MECRSKKKK